MIEKILLLCCFCIFCISFINALTVNKKRTANILFGCGLILALILFVYRWIKFRQPPFSNIYEAMIFINIPAFAFYFFYTAAASNFHRLINIIIGILNIIYPLFIYNGISKNQPVVLRSVWFVPHVMSYMLSYYILFFSAALAIAGIWKNKYSDEIYKFNKLALPFLTSGLITGCFWAEDAWARFWRWDAKEIWALITYMIFILYFHICARGHKNSRLAHLATIIGIISLLFTYIVVSFSSSIDSIHSYN